MTTSKPRSSKGFQDPLRNFVRDRTDRPRHLYTCSRQLMNLPATAWRRLYASKVAKHAPFEIPRSAGFRVFPPGTFPEVSDVVAAARALELQIDPDEMARRRSRSKKPFFQGILDRRTLTPDSPFLRFALRPDVLAGVTAYLGTVPVLWSIDVISSQSVSDELKSSQLFHCDAAAESQIKIFILCKDVEPENGPLTVMGRQTSKVLRKAVGYNYTRRVTDPVASSVVGERDQHVMVGKAGTVGFVDTSRCFHYGSRVDSDADPRLVVILQYLPTFAFVVPRDYQQAAPYRHLAGPRSTRLARLVLGAEKEPLPGYLSAEDLVDVLWDKVQGARNPATRSRAIQRVARAVRSGPRGIVGTISGNGVTRTTGPERVEKRTRKAGAKPAKPRVAAGLNA